MNEQCWVVVEIEGGVCQRVLTGQPGMPVVVVDWDDLRAGSEMDAADYALVLRWAHENAAVQEIAVSIASLGGLTEDDPAG